MLKNFISVCIAIIITCLLTTVIAKESFAASKIDTQNKNAISELVNKYENGLNNHNLEDLASNLSNDYLSGDNLNKKQILEITRQTWNQYPDIKYIFDINNVRFSDSWAAVEMYINTKGSSSAISNITEDKGDLNVAVHSVIYLRKIGKEWKIIGDYIFFEKSVVKYGLAKSLDINFAAPEQVKAGQMYTAKIAMEVPVGTFILGSIIQEPIIYPQIRSKEVFKTLNQLSGDLERVFESNETNNNEFVTATVGITEITEDNQARPTVRVKGICLIGNRVNVTPSSTFDANEYKVTHKEDLDDDPETIEKLDSKKKNNLKSENEK